MTISLVGVVLAAASAFVIGGLWYSPSLFLKPWMKMTGTTDADMKNGFPAAMGMMLVAALLTAYVLAHFMVYANASTGTTGITNGLETAFWAWLGLSLTTVVTSGALEPRNRMVMVITAGNRLVTLLAMGLILGAFMK
jgi:Protein of unknown function (DUF1761)